MKPNAGHQSRREAAAPRTLYAVACRPLILIEAPSSAYRRDMLSNDTIDSQNIAVLLRGGLLPQA